MQYNYDEYSPYFQIPGARAQTLEAAIKYAIKEGMSEDERDFLIPFFEGKPAPKPEFAGYKYDKEDDVHVFYFRHGLALGRVFIDSAEDGWSDGDWQHECMTFQSVLETPGNEEKLARADLEIAQRVETCWFKRT